MRNGSKTTSRTGSRTRTRPTAYAGWGREFPLVGLTNAMNSQIMSNVDQFGTPFHAVITAEQVRSYKPRMKGFEDILD